MFSPFAAFSHVILVQTVLKNFFLGVTGTIDLLQQKKSEHGSYINTWLQLKLTIYQNSSTGVPLQLQTSQQVFFCVYILIYLKGTKKKEEGTNLLSSTTRRGLRMTMKRVIWRDYESFLKNLLIWRERFVAVCSSKQNFCVLREKDINSLYLKSRKQDCFPRGQGRKLDVLTGF